MVAKCALLDLLGVLQIDLLVATTFGCDLCRYSLPRPEVPREEGPQRFAPKVDLRHHRVGASRRPAVGRSAGGPEYHHGGGGWKLWEQIDTERTRVKANAFARSHQLRDGIHRYTKSTWLGVSGVNSVATHDYKQQAKPLDKHPQKQQLEARPNSLHVQVEHSSHHPLL